MGFIRLRLIITNKNNKAGIIIKIEVKRFLFRAVSASGDGRASGAALGMIRILLVAIWQNKQNYPHKVIGKLFKIHIIRSARCSLGPFDKPFGKPFDRLRRHLRIHSG
jgi:hypothetical protein